MRSLIRPLAAGLMILLVAQAAPAATASPAPSAKGPAMNELSIPHQKFVLPNGLTLVVHEDHATPVVAVNLWYHVGSRNERRGRTGFAHLFEHFFFNGSENHPGGFREAMDDLGANNRNGTTNTDRTNFFEDVPVQALERTLCLEADRMGFLAGRLSTEMLERERGVVKNEKRQGENQPYGRVFNRLAEAMYPYSHPYSWSTIGEMADLDAATIEDIREWYATYYGPNNCVLTLAGDITPEKALELVTKWFGSIPAGPPLPRHESWVGKLGAPQRETMADRVPQARIYRAYHSPQWGHPDAVGLGLATSVLSGSKSARLDRKLVYEKELVTSISAGTWDREIAGLILISATVKEGVEPAVVEREIDAILAEFLKEGPTKAELDRARTRLTTEFVRGIERIGGRANVLAENVTFGGDGNAHVEWFARAAAATPESVRATAKTWLDAPHFTLLVTPFPSLKASDAAGLDRKALPALGAEPDVRFPPVQEMKLANGLRVMLLERHGAPLVQATLALDAGYASDAPARRGLTQLATGLLTDGTTSKDAFALADAMDMLGAEIFATNTQDTSSVKLRALTQNLAGSLDLFADVALRPAFAADRFEQAKRRQIAGIAQEKATPTTAALRVIPAVLYGSEHAYGGPRTGSGTEASVESLTRDDVAAWHAEWFRPGSAVLIVAGDVTMDALMPHVERAFGSWKAGTAPAKSIGEPARGGAGRILLIDKKDAPQSLLLAAHLSERTGTPDDLAIETVMRGFGGMATSRLNRNLRLEKHWSYGMSGMLPDSRGARPLIVVGSVQTDKTTESLLEIAKELRFVAGEKPIAGEEFESLQRSSISRLPGRFETLSSLEAAAESMVAYGYPADYYDKLAANVRALTEADLARAATRFVKPSQVAWVVVGDLSKIEAGIRASGLGDVAIINADGQPVR